MIRSCQNLVGFQLVKMVLVWGGIVDVADAYKRLC